MINQAFSFPIKLIAVTVIVSIVRDVFSRVLLVNHRNVVSNVVCILSLSPSSIFIILFFVLGNLRTYTYEYRLYGTNKEIVQK